MKIVDISVDELSKASRRGRARSQETDQLISAIESLEPKEAKAIILNSGETPQKAKARVAYAARLAGKKLDIAVKDGRVLFGLSQRVRRRRKPAKNG